MFFTQLASHASREQDSRAETKVAFILNSERLSNSEHISNLDELDF